MAEGGRFELPVGCPTTDFESVTFGLSDTPPWVSFEETLYNVFCDFFPALNSWKNPLSKALHSSPRTPAVTATL